MKSDFYKNYYDEYFRLIYSDNLDETFDDFKKLAESVKSNKHKLIFAGNGASASISAHAAVDFTKQAQVCLLYTSPSPRDATLSRMPSSA